LRKKRRIAMKRAMKRVTYPAKKTRGKEKGDANETARSAANVASEPSEAR
jgi:hypothetical protein